MRNHVNLMSEAARFRVAARRRLKRWGAGLLLLGVGLVASAGKQWIDCRAIQQQYDAIEAQYEPVRQLNAMNRSLHTEAAALVQRDKTSLQLANRPSAAVLMELVSAAVRNSSPSVFLSRISLAPNDGADNAKVDAGKVDVEAVTQVDAGVEPLIAELKKAPFIEVKVVSSQIVPHEGHERKVVSIECRY